ncbi:hypothetical protein JAO29_11910 [Edaphobacter sp. HDX4]|uniref:hypothetical protein n=1 Tax=Edaphobacter sp. HDX4 TaxID=2794064 RepID=UPI002FE5F53F
MKSLKRTLAILLLIVFGMPLASPLFASSGSTAERLPACCRRGGKHHCMGGMALAGETASSPTPTFRSPLERCPFYPQAMTAVHRELSTPDGAGVILVSLVSHPCGVAQTESKWRISRDRSRLKRGPPASSLS